MPAEQARFIASAAYTLARAANADMDISAEETAEIEAAIQRDGVVDEPTAVLVTEMAKLQARTVGGTEDFVVTREFRNLATESQRLDVLRACFAIGAASGTISAEENVVVNEIAREFDLDPADGERRPRRVPRATVGGPGGSAGSPGRTDRSGRTRVR